MALSIIHLSDIHITDENDLIIKRIGALKRACASAVQKHSQVVIAITGDIAYSGKIEQYVLAQKMLEEMVEYIIQETSSNVSIVCVPGNHDCDFTSEKSIRKKLVSQVKPDEIDVDFYEEVSAIQENYKLFASTYINDTASILSTVSVQVGDDKVLFVLANSAWMSVLKEEPGKIVMPCSLFPTIQKEDYKAIFYLYHHPDNWLNPDYKSSFEENIRKNADFVLFGHEHLRDSYQKSGSSFSFVCNQGKELQDNYGDSSAFSIINFDEGFQSYCVINYEWTSSKYERVVVSQPLPFRRNLNSLQSVFRPTQKMAEQINDIGIAINHFAKEILTLSDLFVWPDLRIVDFKNHGSKHRTIKEHILREILSTNIAILCGPPNCGKTAIANMLYAHFFNSNEQCCILFNGRDFNTSDPHQLSKVIETTYKNQYDSAFLEDFLQLSKEQKVAIVDNFELIRMHKERRTVVLDYLMDCFGKVIILISNPMEITSCIGSKTLAPNSEVFYYEILPLGNKKRKELISKWYQLDNSLIDEEIEKRIETAIERVNMFLGNGTGVIPAHPVYVLGTLQNSDAIQPTFNGSKYAFLYESLIFKSLSQISPDYMLSGNLNIHLTILGIIAYFMLSNSKTHFLKKELDNIIGDYNKKKGLRTSTDNFLETMIKVQILREDKTSGEQYKFKYPYMFYYFAGKYIEKHQHDKEVKLLIEHMSSKLFVETYGNIIIFICHFANSQEVVDNILLNAYCILDNYDPFDFNKSNSIFNEIRDAVEALIPESIVTNEEVEENRNSALVRMDDVGINDGSVMVEDDQIDEDLQDKDKEFAAVMAAIKSLEVLGQILQTYPGEIDANIKADIIDEMHKLGMRSIQAIINTMGYLERDLVEFLIEKEKADGKKHRRDEIVVATKKFINLLISTMVQGMVHQVAVCLNSNHLLDSATDVFSNDQSISAKLILLDLRLNVLKRPVYAEVESLKKAFESSNETFASCILDSIVGHYLNYNKCDPGLRSRLCHLCGMSETAALIASQRNLLN